jgi:hypothetical protein
VFFKRSKQRERENLGRINDNQFIRSATTNGSVIGITEAYGSKSKSLVVVLRYPLGYPGACDYLLTPAQAQQFARAVADAYRSAVPVVSAIGTKAGACLNVISGGGAQPYVEIAGNAPGAHEPMRLEFSKEQAGLLVRQLLNCIQAQVRR